MKTRKPLRDMLPEIQAHINNHRGYLEYNQRLFNVYEGQLRPEIEAAMARELSPDNFKIARQRIPSINLMGQIVHKLSRVYSEPVVRTAADATDQELLDTYKRRSQVDQKFANANQIYNLQKCAAIEPFLDEGVPSVRVLPAHQFLVYSDDPVNPLRPTVFIKFMGRDRNVAFTDMNGVYHEANQYDVDVYWLYSEREFLIVDSDQQVRTAAMEARALDGSNPLGVIPFVYINKSEFRLIPLPDTDTMDMTVLIPVLFADLTYATKFASHSILAAIDTNVPTGLSFNPDEMWNLKSTDDKQGTIQVIKPSVEIVPVIEMIKTLVVTWLASRNVKAGDMGSVAPGDAASGIARAIDEADTTQDRLLQCGRFADAERAFWRLLKVLHNAWANGDLMADKSRAVFSEALDVTVVFGEQKPVVTDREKVETVLAKVAGRLISRRQGLMEIYPAWSKEQVDQALAELEAEAPSVPLPQGSTSGSPEGNNGQGNTSGDSGPDSQADQGPGT